LNTKRSTLSSLTSPTLSSPPALLSPVVGEFKGWFSNLFNWKTQSYVLYSHDDVSPTRDEAIRLLEQLGVTVASEEADGIPVLRCRVDEGLDIATGLAVQKRTTFRVEFLLQPSTAVGGCGRHGQPQDSFSPSVGAARTGVGFGKNNATKMSGYQCAVVLVQEKGSMSTFRVLARRMKEEWMLDSGLQSPGFGAMSGGGRMTPFVEQVHRFV
jgi:hypothetical protein